MSNAFYLGDSRYFELGEASLLPLPGKPLRLLLLADDLHPANVVQDHINSFKEFSVHLVSVVNTRIIKQPDQYSQLNFDVILIHYSISVLYENYLSTAWKKFISTFRGGVALIHEDEYQAINLFKKKCAELGIQAVFSCLDSIENLKLVYGERSLLRETLFFICLPGYIPSNLINTSQPPISGRPLDIVYRGRILKPQLGRTAQEKLLIGEKMLVVASKHGLTFDISSKEEDRIYGAQWLQFLRSGKAMLGVEGGASIFDFDGKINDDVAAYMEAKPDAEFEEIWVNVLAKHEGNINYRTITPKIFEAISAKTVLVLYPGKYNKVLTPDRHYIRLERDGSNMDDVVAKLKDHSYLQSMADLTYKEIMQRNDLSTQFYVNQIDRVLSALPTKTSMNKA